MLWGPALATIDSDGDGRNNGLELRDPAGAWVAGQPDPGTPSLVTKPGVVDAPPAVPAMPFGVLALFGGVLALLGVTRLRRKQVQQAAALILATSAAMGGTACSNGESAAREGSEREPVPAFSHWYGAGLASLLLALGQMVVRARSKSDGVTLG